MLFYIVRNLLITLASLATSRLLDRLQIVTLLDKTVSSLRTTIVAAIKVLRALIKVRAIMYITKSIVITLVN
jgi:hypothetical protein